MPTSDETTPTWTLGRPPAMPLRTSMKRGKLRASDSCSSFMESELSTTKRMSSLGTELDGMSSRSSVSGCESTAEMERVVQAPRHKRRTSERMHGIAARPADPSRECEDGEKEQ